MVLWGKRSKKVKFDRRIFRRSKSDSYAKSFVPPFLSHWQFIIVQIFNSGGKI